MTHHGCNGKLFENVQHVIGQMRTRHACSVCTISSRRPSMVPKTMAGLTRDHVDRHPFEKNERVVSGTTRLAMTITRHRLGCR